MSDNDDYESDMVDRIIKSDTILNKIRTLLPSSIYSIDFTKIISFATSSSINLVLPFINGFMLGMGELFAHEISWRYHWFNHNNAGYKIFPVSRKYAGINAGREEKSATQNKAAQFI
ncbi:hypothetical protein KAFR_0D01400 [Kazachstania africana CBS 2517]|uniref:Uncharacterized protein n=1 Tax=Kazachstania africana (strain ATCC 22294 / BCRC 22015 / CBS 2517 / CECT 1963 / NBRC 1671 / NRRL Y-8276) TaxID=1071382 RepID=H2ATT6_KAZAF|nr:hypothetical protein KAFR_0D01400 [Kazachstania africana CBS 2517]CCF57786.1 hypothetical protein KAFR_0D01400 [Kazachstania africana CBS 2517]